MQFRFLCSTAVLLGTISSVAFAQDAPVGNPPASTAAAPSTASPASEPRTDNANASASASASASAATPAAGAQLGDIVVTAQRRSESSQRAAVPIAVISAQDVLKNGVSDPTALGALVPALTVTPAGGTRPNFFIRGVGNFTANPIFESAIAFNYDGVYEGHPGSTTGVFYDLERIEVLKGPQGTLYGRNATGGAINIIPVRPKIGELSGYAAASYGNYNAVSVEGAVNLPLGPNGAIRVSGNYVKHDGYLSDGTSDEDTKAFRVQMLGQLTPDLSVRVSFDYAHAGGLGIGTNYLNRYQYIPAAGGYVVSGSGLSSSTGFYDPAAQAFRSSLFGVPAFRFLAPVTEQQFSNNNFYGANAEINYDTGAGKLTIIPAWRYGDTRNLTNTVGFPARIAVKDDQVSLEARFAGKQIGPIDYTLGGYYFYETHKGSDSVNEQTLINFEQGINSRTRSLAAFARLTLHVSDRLRVVGAARYTDDHKVFTGDAEGLTIVCRTPSPFPGPPFFCPTVPLFQPAASLAQLTIPIPPPGGALQLGETGAILARSGSITAVDQPLSKTRVTYRAAVEYDLAPRSLLYASVETGFRSGGFNLAYGYETYKPEYITAFTVGSKNRFFNNRLQLNLEGYYWKYRNQQLAHIGADKGGRQSFFVQNLGDLTIYGVDFDGRLLITPTTVVNAQVQYLHTKYTKYNYDVPTGFPPPFTDCTTTTPSPNDPTLTNVNCAGKPGYNSPTWTINLGGEQTFKLGDYKLVAEVDTQYRTSRYVGFDFVNSERVGSTWQTSAELTFAPHNDAWSIGGFIRNIENNRYLASAASFPIGSTVVGVLAPPRTYGLRGSVKF